jgi:hypothetical protein
MDVAAVPVPARQIRRSRETLALASQWSPNKTCYLCYSMLQCQDGIRLHFRIRRTKMWQQEVRQDLRATARVPRPLLTLCHVKKNMLRGVVNELGHDTKSIWKLNEILRQHGIDSSTVKTHGGCQAPLLNS